MGYEWDIHGDVIDNKKVGISSNTTCAGQSKRHWDVAAKDTDARLLQNMRTFEQAHEINWNHLTLSSLEQVKHSKTRNPETHPVLIQETMGWYGWSTDPSRSRSKKPVREAESLTLGIVGCGHPMAELIQESPVRFTWLPTRISWAVELQLYSRFQHMMWDVPSYIHGLFTL